jgi:hypothetical protein
MGMTTEQQEQLLKDVAEIRTALVGDARYQQRGIVGDVADLKGWRDAISAKLLYVTGAVAASWFFICLIGYVGYEWVKTKLEH